MNSGSCPNRAESAALNDKTKSLVLVNYYKSVPIMKSSCEDNSPELLNMLQTCYGVAGNRWANFIAVDFYKVKLLFFHHGGFSYRNMKFGLGLLL